MNPMSQPIAMLLPMFRHRKQWTKNSLGRIKSFCLDLAAIMSPPAQIAEAKKFCFQSSMEFWSVWYSGSSEFILSGATHAIRAFIYFLKQVLAGNDPGYDKKFFAMNRRRQPTHQEDSSSELPRQKTEADLYLGIKSPVRVSTSPSRGSPHSDRS